jgi:putative PEP-CTERM system TPR-repeat lipoprotein
VIDIHEAKEVFAQSSSSNPKNAEESARIGMLKLMMNDPSGMDSLKESIVMNPDFIEAELALAYAAIKTGDIEQATEIAIKWQGKYPTKPDGYNLMAVIFLQSSQNDKAKKELDKSLKLDEKNLFALSKLIIISAQENNEKEVQRLSTKLLKLYPNNVKVLTQYFQLNPNVVGLAEVEKAYKANPKELNTGVLYAGALMHLKEYQKTIDLLEQYQPDSRTPKVYWKLLYGANRQLEKMEQSNRILKQWRKTSPYHIEPVMMLADGFAKKGKYDRALTIINQALALNKSAKVLKLVKMQLLLDSKQLAEGQRLFDTLDKGKLTDIVKLNFQGRLLLLEKKYQQASNKLEVLYKKSPSDQNLLYLVSAYKNNKEDNKAIIILERHLVKNTENDQLKNLLASFYLKKQKSKALSLYAQLYQRHPTNFVLNNNLAWLYMEKGELTLALSHAEKAYELAPENPNVVDTYGQVLLKNGNKRLALEKSEQAYSLSETKNIDIALNYIEALVVNSRKNKAKKLLDQLSVDSIEQNKKKAQLINQL